MRRVVPGFCVLSLLAAGLGALVFAQGEGYPMSYAPAMWGGGMGSGNRASTAAQGAMMGASDVIRAAGAANLMNSAAAINVEEARSKYINNRMQGTKTYFEMKQYNKDYRNANKAPRPTSEQLFRLAKSATPKELSPDQLDPVTGQIKWPDVLMTDDFSDVRQTLETLYAERANASGKINFEQYTEIRKSTQQMQDALKSKISDMPPQVFSQANAFIKQLEHAAQLAG